MNSRAWCRIALAFALMVTNSCSESEPRIKAAPALFIPNPPIETTSDKFASVPVGYGTTSKSLDLECTQHRPCLTRLWDSLTGVSSDDCVYSAFTEKSVDEALITGNPAIISNTVYQVLNQSDQNCNTWHARVFAFRTGTSFAGNFSQQVLGTGGAVAGLLSGPAAAGVSAGNAALNAFMTNLNTSYYFNKYMDQIDTQIATARQQKASDIIARLPQTPAPTVTPTATPTPGGRITSATTSDSSALALDPTATSTPTPTATPGPKYTGIDAKRDLIAYDSLCSLEIIATSTAATSTPTATATPTPTPTATKTAPSGEGGHAGRRRSS